MEYLIGKCLKATKQLNLIYRVVDNKLYSISNYYAPKIQSGDLLYVKDIQDDIVILQNLSSDDWKTCELRLEDIEDFKVISMNSI